MNCNSYCIFMLNISVYFENFIIKTISNNYQLETMNEDVLWMNEITRIRILDNESLLACELLILVFTDTKSWESVRIIGSSGKNAELRGKKKVIRRNIL